MSSNKSIAVMSLGAGFYEELTFRVLLFGLGAKLLVWVLGRERVEIAGVGAARTSFRSMMIMLAWAVVCALIFSGVHYVGFKLRPVSGAGRLVGRCSRGIFGKFMVSAALRRGVSL